MNVELLERIANWLEDGAPHVVTPSGTMTGFNLEVGVQVQYDPDGEFAACGTVCCIAGAACMFGNDISDIIDNEVRYLHDMEQNYTEVCWSDISRRATKILDIPELDADWLYREGDGQGVTAEMAARTIRHYLETGEVVWEDKVNVEVSTDGVDN